MTQLRSMWLVAGLVSVAAFVSCSSQEGRTGDASATASPSLKKGQTITVSVSGMR